MTNFISEEERRAIEDMGAVPVEKAMPIVIFLLSKILTELERR